MIDLTVLTAECTLKFHKLRMAEYPVQDVFGDGVPTFQLQASIAVDQANQTGTKTDRPPSSDSYELLYAPLQPTNQRAKRLHCIPSGRAHSMFRRLWMSGFFNAVE